MTTATANERKSTKGHKGAGGRPKGSKDARPRMNIALRNAMALFLDSDGNLVTEALREALQDPDGRVKVRQRAADAELRHAAAGRRRSRCRRAFAAKNPSEPKRSKTKSERARDHYGRFTGVRFDVEGVPRLPTFPACWVLDDPRRRPYLVFWDRGGDVYALKMAPSDTGNAVLVTLDTGEAYRIEIVRRPLPRRSGTALFCLCPRCLKPRRYLYMLSRVGTELVDYQGLRCQRCAGLRYRIQGYYRSAFSRRLFRQPDGRTTIPLPREPWDPRAVSDPRLIADEFRGETEDPPPPPGAGADDVRPVGGAAGGGKR